ncbi:hypothetical protein [Rickettsiella massiliensis]|uniref:hypothetical protein n=1 Tax=Rickettsiella massiliensis TaxID=676517 RepID=UPI00029A7BBC|nr:hypothetical protein [Rickettsiella massiliensis]
MHYELAPIHRRTLEKHHKYLEKMIHETKKHLGIHAGGEVMKLKDHHQSRATEDGVRKKRKYTKRK